MHPGTHCVCTYVFLYVCTCALLSSQTILGLLGDGAEHFNICKESGSIAKGVSHPLLLLMLKIIFLARPGGGRLQWGHQA